MVSTHEHHEAAGVRDVPAVSMVGVTKRFPGVVANDAVDFEVRAGEVHALLGENGAGKSTLSNILTGLYRPDEGEVWLAGRRVEFRSPREAIEAGVCMVHQHFRLVTPFTVAENVILGDLSQAGRGFRIRTGAIEHRVAELAERYGVPVDPSARIWQLSVGEQQRVEILKALYRDAKILILDEPTAVLTPQESKALFVTLRQMADEGRTVIFISHKLHEVLAVSDRITVLRQGRSVGTIQTADSTTMSLTSLMVGRDVAPARRLPRTNPVGGAVLELDDVSAAGDRGQLAVDGASLTIHAGEIVGLAGVAGNGQRELAELVTGMRPVTSGAVRVNGDELRSGDPRDAIRRGIAHVPEDRLGTGVAPSLSIAANTVLKAYRSAPASRGPILRIRAIRARAVDLIERYDVRTPGPDIPARDLSGGNLQKVVLGREFGSEPIVLIAASPTRGLDVGALETVHGLLRDATTRGIAILLISEDLDEIRALSDRIAVMYEGRIVGVVDAGVATVEELGLMMAGANA